MNIILEKPVFIESAFTAPMFNQEFADTLIMISEHLADDIEKCYPTDTSRIKEYIPDGKGKDDKLCEDTLEIIHEIIQINADLLAKQPFDIARGFSPINFSRLNVNAAILSVITAKEPFISAVNYARTGQCMRELTCLRCYDNTEFYAEYIRIDFLYRFLLTITYWFFKHDPDNRHKLFLNSS